MSTPITDRAAQVLREIDAALALDREPMKCPHCKSGMLWSDDRGAHCDGCDDFDEEADLPASRTLLPASLRCLKTAIEGLMDAEGWIAAAQDDALSAESYGRAERYREASEDCAARLKSILDTWEAGQ